MLHLNLHDYPINRSLSGAVIKLSSDRSGQGEIDLLNRKAQAARSKKEKKGLLVPPRYFSSMLLVASVGLRVGKSRSTAEIACEVIAIHRHAVFRYGTHICDICRGGRR